MIPTREVPLCRECLTDNHAEHESGRLRSMDDPTKTAYCKCPICTTKQIMSAPDNREAEELLTDYYHSRKDGAQLARLVELVELGREAKKLIAKVYKVADDAGMSCTPQELADRLEQIATMTKAAAQPTSGDTAKIDAQFAEIANDPEYQKEAVELAEGVATAMPDVIAKLRATIASGRTINNFSHVPEAVRALEWVLMDFDAALASLCGEGRTK